MRTTNHPPTSRRLSRRTTPFLIFRPISNRCLFTIRINGSRGDLSFVRPLTRLTLIGRRRRIKIISSNFLSSETTSSILCLLHRRTSQNPRLANHLMRGLSMFNRRQTNGNLPHFLCSRSFTILLSARLLWRCVRSGRYSGERRREVVLCAIGFRSSRHLVRR